MLRCALAVLCLSLGRGAPTARLVCAWTLPVPDLVLAIFAPEGSGAIIRKWALSPHLLLCSFQYTVSTCQSVVTLLSPSQVILHNSITWLVYIACFSQQPPANQSRSWGQPGVFKTPPKGLKRPKGGPTLCAVRPSLMYYLRSFCSSNCTEPRISGVLSRPCDLRCTVGYLLHSLLTDKNPTRSKKKARFCLIIMEDGSCQGIM
jgi:hypothetical protein